MFLGDKFRAKRRLRERIGASFFLRLAFLGRATWTARGVLRGGSWNNNPQNLRAADRNNNNPDNRNNNIGFRVALGWQYDFRQNSRVKALEGVHFSSRAAHEDHGRGKWFAPDTAAEPVLALGRQGPRSSQRRPFSLGSPSSQPSPARGEGMTPLEGCSFSPCGRRTG